MLAANLALGFQAPGLAPVQPTRTAISPIMETKADLEALAVKLNPVVCVPHELEHDHHEWPGPEA